LVPLWRRSSARAPAFRCFSQLASSSPLAAPPPPPTPSAAALGQPPLEPHARPLSHLASPLPLGSLLSDRRLATKALARDPERPKRPASPWLRFLAEFRQQRKEVKHKEVMQVAATEWKAMPDGKKSPWIQPYEVEKQKYDKAFKEYSDSGKLDAWKRDPEKPKKPLTPFLEYTGEFRKKNPSLKVTEVTKQASSSWKLLPAEQKAPYERRYEEASKKYKVAMEEYKASGKEAAWKEKKGLTPKEQLKQKEAEKKKKAQELKVAQKAKAAAKKAKDKELKAKKKEAEAIKKAKKTEVEAAKKAKKKATDEAKKAKKAEMAATRKVKAPEAKAPAKPAPPAPSAPPSSGGAFVSAKM